MQKILLIVLLSFIQQIFSQEETLTSRLNNSKIDQGWYLDTTFRGRWNPFGACYRTKVYYRKALSRQRDSFWFANSSLELGIEQSIASYSRTSAFIFWQPIIALNFTFKVAYFKDFIKPAALNGAGDDYNFALPPFTGLNPMNRKPIRLDVNTLEIEFTPILTIGGAAGPGMLALIYAPTVIYFHNFGLNPNQYIFNNRETIILKAQDIFFRHDIKLGYNLSGTGMNFAFTTIIEHIYSISGIFRAGLFGSFSYEKASKRFPDLIPYIRLQVGSWIKDRYMKDRFAIQLETGVKWKFK